MTDPREPLWASSLADESRPDYDDVIVRVLDEPDEPRRAEPPPREPGERPPLLALGLLAGVFLLGLLIATPGRTSWTVEDVPSYWGEIPMTCHTVRLEQDAPRAAEWFWCRSLGGRRLPPGLYESPESQWTSDLTRRVARENRIRITEDGDLSGWARY